MRPDGRITQFEWASSTPSPGDDERGGDELRDGQRQVRRLELLRPPGARSSASEIVTTATT